MISIGVGDAYDIQAGKLVCLDGEGKLERDVFFTVLPPVLFYYGE